MPNINEQFDSKYLRAHDVGEEGVIVTIAAVKPEKVGDENKPVMYFRGQDKPLILNKTNAKKIATLLKSDDTDDWVDGQIRLFATETEFQGQTVPCIRIKQAAVPTRAQDAKGRNRVNAPLPADDGSDPF